MPRRENPWILLLRAEIEEPEDLMLQSILLDAAIEHRPGFVLKKEGVTVIARFAEDDTLRVHRRRSPKGRTYPKRPVTRTKERA